MLAVQSLPGSPQHPGSPGGLRPPTDAQDRAGDHRRAPDQKQNDAGDKPDDRHHQEQPHKDEDHAKDDHRSPPTCRWRCASAAACRKHTTRQTRPRKQFFGTDEPFLVSDRATPHAAAPVAASVSPKPAPAGAGIASSPDKCRALTAASAAAIRTAAAGVAVAHLWPTLRETARRLSRASPALRMRLRSPGTVVGHEHPRPGAPRSPSGPPPAAPCKDFLIFSGAA